MGERPLTPLELETFVLMTHGYSDKDVAKKTSTSEQGVRQTLRRVLRKLGAVNRGHATRLGFQRGILTTCPKNCAVCKGAPGRKRTNQGESR